MEENKDYISRIKYFKLLRRFRISPNLLTGYFYSFQNMFTLNENFDEMKSSIKDFYDFFPIVYVFEVNKKTKSFTGINFHQMPVFARNIWFTEFQKYIKGRKRVIVKPELLHDMYRRSSYSIRQYRMERTFQLRKIPIESLLELFNYIPKTYYNATIKQIAKKYKKYRPKI